MKIYAVGTKFKNKKNAGEARVVSQPQVPDNRWDTYVMADESGEFPVSQHTLGREWEPMRINEDPTYRTHVVSVKNWESPATPLGLGAGPGGPISAMTSGTHTTLPPKPRKTFYLAASSKDIEVVRRRAVELNERGYDWYGGLDWTLDVEKNIPEPLFCGAAHNDLAAAVNADLFVLVISDDFSFGAAAEFGARVSAGKVAHVVVRPENKHPFLCHSKVERFDSWESFATGLRGDR